MAGRCSAHYPEPYIDFFEMPFHGMLFGQLRARSSGLIVNDISS